MGGLSTVLKKRRKELGLTLSQIADMMGVAEATVQRWESGNIKSVRHNKIAKLAEILNVSPAHLMGWEDDSGWANLPAIAEDLAQSIDATPDEVLTEINEMPWSIEEMRASKGRKEIKDAIAQRRTWNACQNELLSDEAINIAKRYDKLDIYGKSTVRAVIEEEETRIKEQAELDLVIAKPEPKVITLYRDPAAAGYLTGDTGNDGEPYVLGPTDPLGAEYAVIIQGDSMEPAFADGTIVFVNHDTMRDGDIGIFCVDGKTVIKQWHYDKFMGITYLLSLNRQRADADIVISKSSGRTLVWQGRVITKKRYPLPM